ncbi:hypothetical protein LX77_03870 [Gelidibacter algens]|uniref:Phage tail protein n=1 Tax=Gelidibacter algens TaxID=49280 RepID=A0A1A7QRY7_9FLAO|nr:hypothetical protein [Gelidibacter algens]OBX22088.1 hypothetical protein A9996_17385 [Gelidibacter algens]RAJ17527.1 hypothetical protein LX77_03870 [Gelidibacter algens]
MKTLNTILISGASGKFSEISGLDDNAKKCGNVILKNVVFQPQTNLWAGYGTPLDKEGTVVLEEKNEAGESLKTWKLSNAKATKFSTGDSLDGAGPSFESIELSYDGIKVESR